MPFFVAGGAAIGRGRGERLEAVTNLLPLHFVVVRPPQGLSTADVYAHCRVARDPRSSAGAAVIAGAVALALQDRLEGTDAVVAQLVEWSAPLDRSFAKELGRLPGWLDLVPEAAGPEIARAGLQLGFSDRWQGISPFVTSSVLWSLYSVLRSPDDYWETICTAIAVGGDVDTTAAMAGAISGAALGLRAIPHDLAARLTDQETWGYNELVRLAERCHEIKAGQL